MAQTVKNLPAMRETCVQSLGWKDPLKEDMATHSSIFKKKEYWGRLPCPPPGDLPNPGIEPGSPALQADSLPSEPPGKP